MASALVSKARIHLESRDHVDIEHRSLEKRLSFKETILAQLGADAFHQNLQKPDHADTDFRLQRCRSFTEKILAIQSLTHPGRHPVLPPDSSLKKTLRIRVAKARVQCHRHFLNGLEKLEPIADSRQALAQKLIAKALRRSDRRRRPRRRLIFRIIRKKTILSPIMACLQWLREPLVRLARVASLAAAKVELHQSANLRNRRNGATCFPLVDVHNLPLLTTNPFLE